MTTKEKGSEKKERIQLEFLPERLRRIDKTGERMGVMTRTEQIRQALSTQDELAWMTDTFDHPIEIRDACTGELLYRGTLQKLLGM